jgi:hypothetical protein
MKKLLQKDPHFQGFAWLLSSMLVGVPNYKDNGQRRGWEKD